MAALPSDHRFRRWAPSKPPWLMARYLFSNPSLKNVGRKWQEFRALCETPESSIAAVQEASWLAELEAYWILTRELGFEPTGVDVRSPHVQGRNRNCDLGGRWRGNDAYVEVKSRAREDRERVPDSVHQLLAEMEDELGYNLTPKCLDGSAQFDAAAISRLESELHRRVDNWRDTRQGLGLDVDFGPETFAFRDHYTGEGILSVMFAEKSDRSYARGEFFTPLRLEEVETWLFGRRHDRRGGKVDEALSKGATVLAIRVATFLELEEIRNQCFPGAHLVAPHEYEVDSHQLGGLQAVLLFSKWDKYELFTLPRSTRSTATRS